VTTRYVLIVRHGDYGRGDKLVAAGRGQMDRLGAEIRRRFAGKSFALLSSPAPWAAESSKRIGAFLGIAQPLFYEILWSDEHRRTNLPEALEVIDAENGYEVVIVVTHSEYSWELPRFFGDTVLGVNNFQYEGLERGSAWVIDCTARTCTMIDAKTLVF